MKKLQLGFKLTFSNCIKVMKLFLVTHHHSNNDYFTNYPFNSNEFTHIC